MKATAVNVGSFFVEVWEWLVAAWAYITKNPLPAPDPSVPLETVCYNIIMSESISIPPMPGTGGVIHPVLPADATYIATNVVARNVTINNIVLKLAWIKNESRFDHLAFNPNDQLNVAGQTADQELQHADIGLAQFDMATLKGDYAGQFANMTDAEIETTAFELDWAYTSFEEYTNALLGWALTAFDAATITINGNDYPFQTMCALEAYNKGREGVTTLVSLSKEISSLTYKAKPKWYWPFTSLKKYKTDADFYTTNFAYAIGILDDAATYTKSFAS